MFNKNLFSGYRKHNRHICQHSPAASVLGRDWEILHGAVVADGAVVAGGAVAAGGAVVPGGAVVAGGAAAAGGATAAGGSVLSLVLVGGGALCRVVTCGNAHFLAAAAA